MMTLSDILVRAVQIEWHEAVALVRDVIARAPTRSGVATAPEFHHIELLPQGNVNVRQVTDVADPIQRYQQMLEMLFGANKPPAQFSDKLFSPHESLEAFSASLEYFERPDRASVLATLYSRASGSERLANADELIAALRASTAVSVATSAESKAAEGQGHPSLVYAAGGLALLTLVALVALFMRVEGAGSSIEGASKALSAKLAEGVAAVGSAAASMGGRETRAPAVASAPESPKLDPLKVSRSSGGRDSRGPGARRPVAAEPATAIDVLRSGIKGGPRIGALPSPEVPADMVELLVPAEDPTIVYSAEDADVSAPDILRPQLPSTLPTWLKAQNVPSIELVILADGSVDSVKLLGEPRNVHDSMLLSAAKAWRFSPALKNGAPVTYRMAILVAR